MRGPVAFFFLGETLLIPHLYPVVEALAAEPDVAIDLWVSTSVHEALLGRWTRSLGPAAIRIRRAPGYRTLQGYDEGQNPPLPNKLLMLARLVPRLRGTAVVVSAEQTSLWIPTLLPVRARFVNIMHGAGSISARDGRRRAAAWRMPVPSLNEHQEFLRRGYDPSYVPVVGYTKSAFSRAHQRPPVFPTARPTVLYTPHWQRHRSSWWGWGREVVRQLVEQPHYNVILAPHQRLIEGAPELRAVLAEAAQHPHVHCDFDSFAMVDGSYTTAADIYVGDTSSQAVEFMARPRPCVFLNHPQVDWQARHDYSMWRCGEVLHDVAELMPALARAPQQHAQYVAAQQQFVEGWLGDTSGAAARRVAGHILEALRGC